MIVGVYLLMNAVYALAYWVTGGIANAGIRYTDVDIAFGMRPADVLSELPNGKIRVDLGQFHRLVPGLPVTWDLEAFLEAQG